MKKNVFISIISSIVLVLAILLLAGCGGSKKTNSKPQTTSNNGGSNGGERLVSSARVIKVVQIEGVATVTDDKGSTACFAGMNLYDGDTLTVGTDSTLVVKFDEDKYVYLGENTVIKIKSEGKDKFKTNVYVTSGVVLAEVKNKLDEDEEFFLSSNNSVMAVRGTVFGLDVEVKEEEIVETYAVYRGITELYVFDKKDDRIISGKISDISNAKYELTIPKTNIISESEINSVVGEWLDKTTSTFDDANDANDKLNEVEITVSKPSRKDFEKVTNVVDSPVNYSGIQYTSRGFFGEYDGAPHKISVTPTTAGATVTYSRDGETYVSTNDFEFTVPGSYRVYYKIECDGYDTKTDYEVVYITKPTVKIVSDALVYDNTSNMSYINLIDFEPADFNKYNGVSISKVLENVHYSINDVEVNANDIDVSYRHITDDFIELVDGRNILNVTFEFDNYDLTTEVYFLFSDTRDESGYEVGVSSTYLKQLNNNLYYFDATCPDFDTTEVTTYSISGGNLTTAFGLDVLDLQTMLINYNKDVLDGTEIANYATNDVTIPINQFFEINFLVFPDATTKGYSETVYVYIADEEPGNNTYPRYTITTNNLSYNPNKTPEGVKADFIDSTYDVTYSLDGNTYSANLYLTDAGNQKVYYKISGNNEGLTIKGSTYINVVVGEGVITFDNKMFITNPVHIVSDDNYSLNWYYVDSSNTTHSGQVTSNDGVTITSLNDAYLVYTNMIKNAVFYDSITNEVLDANVVVSDKVNGSANFNYKVEVEGYDTLTGTVRFENVGFQNMEFEDDPDSSTFDVTVSLPVDYSISLSMVSQAMPSRVSLSLENEFVNYQTYYSVDSGKTWVTEKPKFTTAGEYSVYVLYCFVDSGNDATTLVDGTISGFRHSDLSANGNFIIAIQNITVSE